MAEEHPYRAVGQPRPSGAVMCPRCKLVCPATTMWCDCGWDFEHQVVHDPPHRRHEEREQRAFLRMLVGVFVAAVAAAISFGTNSGVIWYGGIIGGVAMAVNGWRRRRDLVRRKV